GAPVPHARGARAGPALARSRARHRLRPAQQRPGAQLHAAAVAAARAALAVRRDVRRGRPLQPARAVRRRALRHAAVQRAAVVAGPRPGRAPGVTAMMHSDLVSVLMPAFKPEFLREAMGSVLRQTHAELELLIGDNSGDPAIRAIIADFGDPRV